MKSLPYLFAACCLFAFLSCKTSHIFDTDAKVKVLYHGIDNKVYIYSPDIHKVKFTSANADVKVLNDTTLSVITKAKGRVDIKLDYKGKTRILSFRAQEIPEANLTFRGRSYDGTQPMPVNEAKATQSVQTSIPNFPYDCRVEFPSMDIIQIRGDKKIRNLTVQGNDLKGALSGATAGDIFIFSNIKLKLTGGGEFKGANTVLKISEAE